MLYLLLLCFRRRDSPTSLSLHPLLLPWWTTWSPPTPLTMTSGPHPDLVEQVDQVVLHFFPAQVQAEEVGMEVEAEWAEAWASWEAREDQAEASLDEGHHSVLRRTLDLTTS